MKLKVRTERWGRWGQGLRGGLMGFLLIALPAPSNGGAESAQPFQPLMAQDVIIYPPVILPYPYPYPAPVKKKVRVQFVAEGTDWGAVYLDDRLLYRPSNFNRRREFLIDEGAYHLRVTGVVSFEVWDSGYLDVGRGDSRALVVIFSKTGGVRVAGDPYAWIPDVR